MRSGKDFLMETFEKAAEVSHAGLQFEGATANTIEALDFIQGAGKGWREPKCLQVAVDGFFILIDFNIQPELCTWAAAHLTGKA